MPVNCSATTGDARVLSAACDEWYYSIMDFYLVALATGGTGLAVMALGGLSHGGHAHHGAPHAHGGHAHAHGGRDTHAGHEGHGGSHLLSYLSPRVLFAGLVGFGGGGLLAAPLGEPWRLAAGILAAVAFESLLVGPLWRFLFRFESQPAATLDSAIEDDARAVTGFDANGQGLVAVDVDGQIVQLLATLDADSRSRGVRIRTGDVVRISEIDPARGSCVVRVTDR
jgi:translation initiation factor IF-1